MEKKGELQGTELAYLREQIRSMEKLASLGMLNAGIAHEIQNPLNFVINFSGMSCRLLDDLKMVLDEQQEVLSPEYQEEIAEIRKSLTENLEKIKEHGERAVSIIRGILLYSRGKEDEFLKIDIGRLVKEYVWLAYHAMRANDKELNIAIHEEYEAGLPEMKMVPQDLSRVVLNLMSNACYAVQARAKQETAGYQPEIKIELKAEGKGFQLSIADNGTGMTEAVKQKVFTAFFTTKPLGEGTGLGLSIVRSVVEEKYKGKVEFETKAGAGTRFVVRMEEVN